MGSRRARAVRTAAVLVSLVSVVALAAFIMPSISQAANSSAQWPMFGQNYNNTASGTTSINTKVAWVVVVS